MRRFVSGGRIGGVGIHIHWTLLVACALILLGSLQSLAHAAGAAIALLAYFAAVLLHEWGHVVVARRRMCQVFGIELYPFVGLTRFQNPRTRFDHCLIAWAGVVFQGAVGLPMLLWITLVGYTTLEVVNAFMAVFSFLTVVMVLLNLMPIPPLDGAVAWGIVPLLFRRLRERHRGRSTGWNSLDNRDAAQQGDEADER